MTAPYSLYRKGSSKTPSHRFTYASLVDSSRSDKSQLVCFHEKILGDKADTTKSTFTSTVDARLLAIEVLPIAASGSSKDLTHDVLLTFDNGHATCLSANLDIVRWESDLRSLKKDEDDDFEFKYTSLATAKAVSRGLLRSREDITTSLIPSGNGADIADLTQVLCVIGTSTKKGITLSLYQIQPRSADLNSAQRSPLKELVSWFLQMPMKYPKIAKSALQFSIHAASGVLQAAVEEKILTYTFATIIPELSSQLAIPGLGLESFLRLSQESVITSSPQAVRILDVKYGSLLALRSIDVTSTTSDTASPTKKRKISHSAEEEKAVESIRLIAYHADANLVIGLLRNDIVGLQWDTSSGRQRGKPDTTLLIEAIGRGVAQERRTLIAQTEFKFAEHRAKLDRYAAKGGKKLAKFEEVFASDLGIELDVLPVQNKRENEVNGGPLTNGVGPKIPDEDIRAIDKDDEAVSEDVRKWRMPTSIPDHRRLQYDRYAIYALSKIFRRNQPQGTKSHKGALSIDFFPPNVFEWVLHTGHLTKESVARALDDSMEGTVAFSTITDRDIIMALVEYDPELYILSAILNQDQYLSPAAVVQVVKLLIQSLDEEPRDETTKLLTNGTASSEDEMEVDITSELDAATNEIDHALSILNQGLQVRTNTLPPALTRLHKFSSSTISSTLRSTLSRHDLESLIRLLHSELRRGGWSTNYDFADEEHTPVEAVFDTPEDDAVAIIASLLSCSLDAIGTGAWVTSMDASTNPQQPSDEFISALLEDASETLSSFWEARYIRGLLCDFLRFASKTPKSNKISSKTAEKQNKPFAVTNEDGDLPMLPLGAKPDMGVERTKAGKGGKKEERSKREMGMLISKRVPKYSFERIVV